MADKDLELKEKQELDRGAEETRSARVFIPPVDIYESENALTLLADMPGIPIENVSIDLNDDKLTIRGTAKMENGCGRTLFKEYSCGDYLREFSLSNSIDKGKIEASMKDGVLKLALPKAEAVKPRKIAVNG